MAVISAIKTVCLITNGHISSNPRLIKEAIAFSDTGIKVALVSTQYVPYLVDYDSQILNDHPNWDHQSLNRFGQTFTSKFHLLKSRFLKLSGNPDTRINNFFFWQLKKAVQYKADLYIAHNLGALPVAVLAAKKTNVKCGFDAEDFHRNEGSDDAGSYEVRLKTLIEEKYIPQLDHMTAASPLIAEKYSSIFKREVNTILNVFPKTHQPKINNNTTEPLKLFWFSQTVGPNRGLESVVEGMVKSGLHIEMHLLGKASDDYDQLLNGLIKNTLCSLHFHKPIFPDEIFSLAAQFDIGVASETHIPLNRNICLTNKIFTYVQCGLAVIASDTDAQKDFINEYPGLGKLYANAGGLAEVLIGYDKNRALLHQTKAACYEAGQTELN
jgi:glycosyltransferase involved in cell wall biosynthesis